MPMLIGPSHHIYYGSLHRRRIWLAHLSEAFEDFAIAGWTKAKLNLDTKFARPLERLSLEGHLGIQHSLPLRKVIDDTPVDSFLTRLTEELEAYEHELFELILRFGSKLDWRSRLEEVSMLWGRELAHETRIAMSALDAPELALPRADSRSLKGISVVFQNILQGGDFSWRPLLFRRRTDFEVQYELRGCPHRKGLGLPGTRGPKEGADLACKLEAKIFEGFTLAFFQDARYERRSREDYCMDDLKLEG